jgi:hypothetical protein
MSSRSTKGVQRVATISAPFAIGQNWLYLLAMLHRNMSSQTIPVQLLNYAPRDGEGMW